MVDIQQKVLSLWLQSAASFLNEELTLRGRSTFDYGNNVNLAGYSLPTWSVGNQKITGDFTLVDRLLEKENIGCTIFQLQDNTFVRVSTNVRKPDGTRIMNTVLDPTGPVYKRLIQGLPYLGRANVEGAMWATVYQPIRDQEGKMIGAFVLGRREQEYELINAIKNIVVGETGYVFVLDPEGRAIIHPTVQGQSLAEYPWVSEILQKKNGFITYEIGGRKKIANYVYYEPWNWYIVTAAYESEIFNTTRKLSEMLLLTILIAVAISFLIAYILSITFSKPISEFVQVMRLAQSGDLSAKLHYVRNDEFKILGGALNTMLDNIALLIGRISGNSRQLKEASRRLIIDIDESNQAIRGLESGIENLKHISASMAVDDYPSASGLQQELQQAIYQFELQIEKAAADKQFEESQSVNALLEKMELLARRLQFGGSGGRNADMAFDSSAAYLNKINGLEIEVQKLRLLLKNICSSASSLDDIAVSLDRHVNVFKVEKSE